MGGAFLAVVPGWCLGGAWDNPHPAVDGDRAAMIYTYTQESDRKLGAYQVVPR
ncbi:MAG TPA: hypothetical protein V6D20_10930 [Candidatus Obscuribacterales bacterium]